MKKLVFVVSVLACAAAFAAVPKYVFVFIGDGMALPHRMVAEEFSIKTGGGRLAMNTLPYQAGTTTKSANAIITDSAAAATAIACGEKTNNGMLGQLPDGTRIESSAAVAKKRGMKVGIMTTVSIVHATPAGFYAHRPNRGQYYQIALDLIDSGYDYFAAAGVYDKYDDRKNPEYRGNVFELARQAGYEICTNRAEWAALKPGGKSWSVFGSHALPFSIDSDGSLPSIAEILAKGIEVLDNPDGFFIMCEGGKVDHSGHANDAATNLREVLALDNAVRVALDFQKKHADETLVIVTGDHETGGLSMGFAGIGGSFRVELLANQKISTEKFSSDVKALINERKGQIAFDEMRPTLKEKFGFVFPGESEKKDDPMLLTEKEIQTLEEAFKTDVGYVLTKLKDTTAHDVARRYVFAQAVKNVLNSHAGVGWSSGSHTALPTFTTAIGPGAEILVGMSDNAEIGRRMKALLAK